MGPWLLALCATFAAGSTRGTASARRHEEQARARREIAVTFDDLPLTRLHADGPAADDRITVRLLSAVTRHRVPAIGFVNERKVARDGRIDERGVALLQRWVAAGVELGNHTYSHVDLHTTPIAAFEAEVARGDSVTRRLLAAVGARPRYFRHPQLHTGRDLGTRRRLEAFLASRGYRVAPVTIDNGEYIFAAAYERALRRGGSLTASRIADAYIPYMERVVEYYERQSVALFGREIPQVLLLHANPLNADRFDALATMIARRGYVFVSLDRALADSAYASRDDYTGPSGISWIRRWALTQGKRGPFFAGEPEVPAFVSEEAGLPRR